MNIKEFTDKHPRLTAYVYIMLIIIVVFSLGSAWGTYKTGTSIGQALYEQFDNGIKHNMTLSVHGHLYQITEINKSAFVDIDYENISYNAR